MCFVAVVKPQEENTGRLPEELPIHYSGTTSQHRLSAARFISTPASRARAGGQKQNGALRSTCEFTNSHRGRLQTLGEQEGSFQGTNESNRGQHSIRRSLQVHGCHGTSARTHQREERRKQPAALKTNPKTHPQKTKLRHTQSSTLQLASGRLREGAKCWRLQQMSHNAMQGRWSHDVKTTPTILVKRP